MICRPLHIISIDSHCLSDRLTHSPKHSLTHSLLRLSSTDQSTHTHEARSHPHHPPSHLHIRTNLLFRLIDLSLMSPSPPSHTSCTHTHIENIVAALQLWDIGGQQLGSNMLDTYLRNAHAILLVYDITNYQSFRDLEDWLMFVNHTFKDKERPYVALVGNKSSVRM